MSFCKSIGSRVALIMGIVALGSVPATGANDLGVSLDPSKAGTVHFSQNTTLGYRFTALTSTTVVGLGAYDRNGDGFSAAAHSVGLWDINGNLLGSAVATNASPLVNFFRIEPLLLPVSLTAGQDYVVGAHMAGDQGVLVSGTGNGSAEVDPRIQFVNDRSSTLAIFTYPTFTDGGTVAGGYYGGNIKLATVPEPSSLALLIIAGICLSRRQWSWSR